MTDHASLLRQIRADARPYVEQALDLAEVFTGFRKLASENGLDWGVIKQLIKAELQDEKEGGDEKVSRIIEKADFASAYADMLGLRGGDEKMNNEKITSEQNFDRSTGAVIVTTGDDGGQLSTDGSGNAVGKREQSEKVANERRLHCSSLAVRAVQYPAERGASSSAPFPDMPDFLKRSAA